MNLTGAIWPILIGLYRSGGREAARRAITIPERELAKIQARNKDQVSEAVEKRDAAVDGVLDLVEELANLDDD